MTEAQYTHHFSVLGKFAKLYDLAAAAVADRTTLAATIADQVADGDVAGLATAAAIISRVQQIPTIDGAQTLAKHLAAQYVESDYFRGMLTATPASTAAAAVLAALATDMGAGEDNVTLETKGTDGLVNFLDAVAGAALTWNTAAAETADYPDADYVLLTVVADPA